MAPKLKPSETLAMLRNRLNLRPVRNTTLIDIQVFSENAQEAADLANQIAEAYQQWRLDKGNELVKGGLDSLRKQAREQDEKIAKTTKELSDLRAKLQISDYDAWFTARSP